MPITSVDKIKLNKYLKEHAIDDIYYLDMCEYLGKKTRPKDIEFLAHFTDCVISEFAKEGKIFVKQVGKLVCLVNNFVRWIKEENNEIDEELLDKIRSFENLYLDYISRNGLELDEELRGFCIDTVETVNNCFPNENSDNDSLAKYVVKIKELESKVKECEHIIGNLKFDNGLLQADVEKTNMIVDSLNSDVSSVREELREKKRYIKTVEAELKKLKSKLSELEELYSQAVLDKTSLGDNVNSLNEELNSCRNSILELNNEVSRLQGIVKDYISKEQEEIKQKQKDEDLKSLIYQKLLVDNASVSDLLKYISKYGITTDVNEISKALREMRKEINIVNGSFGVSPSYTIIKPKLNANGSFYVDVPKDCKYMDVLLVSDFHIKEFDKKVLNGFDMINDYCVENNINLILNLGDFYQGFSTKNFDYANACKNYRIVEESIEAIPRAEGVYHAVLGGNHERNMSNYGFNPIKMLVEGRDDFIDLGYYHSTICLDGKYGNVGKFDLHHPSDFDFPVDLDENGFFVDGMNDYLEDIYSRKGRSRDDSYIDIFGHTHRSQFNFASNYCYIPPFYDSKNGKGACHLRIYVDEVNGIKYMVFMPLSVGSKLTKNNEIVYQKVLSR